MGAYMVFFPRARVNVIAGYFLTTVPAVLMIGFWFVLQLLLGVQSFTGGVGSGVAYWAHISAGAIC
jgi:membrane associated rhomboid family serine protease